MQKRNKPKNQKQKNKTTTNVKEHRKYTHANNIYTYIYRFVDGRKFWQVFFSPLSQNPGFVSCLSAINIK